MSYTPEHFDAVVIGGGPAGQKAAIQFAKAKRRVLLVDRNPEVGGECVHRGTIPSKTLRETAALLVGLNSRTEGVLGPVIGSDLTIESLLRRQSAVCRAHEVFIREQVDRNKVTFWHGHARFLSPDTLEIKTVGGGRHCVSGSVVVIATGSRPRAPSDIPVDHEHILDSDSLLSLIYLPATLTVLGAGIIACEFASVFAALGVQVTMIDKLQRPLAFLDPELTEGFLSEFERRGGRYMSGRAIERVESDGFASVTTVLDGGEEIRSEKVLCALGRMAQVGGLNIEAAGLVTNPRGHLVVDQHFRSSVPHIYAVGDVIGPPALAATSMEQGRRAARHALGLPVDNGVELTPVGIYTIPEMASVGLTAPEAVARVGNPLVGRARFRELARGQINGDVTGLLKLIAHPADGRILGAQVLGETATEMIHLAQLAMLGGLTVDHFIDRVFNFPTMAEAYRVAALDIGGQRAALEANPESFKAAA